MSRWLEPAVLLVGSALIVLGIGLIDWRAGLSVGGLLLVLSSVDVRSQT